MSNPKKPKRPSQPIHPTVFITIGIAIVTYSLFVLFTTKEANQSIMTFFIIVGSLFLITGIIKNYLSKGKNPKINDEKQLANEFTGIPNKAPINAPKTVILCPKCKSRNYSTSNFCHMCGARLR